VAAEEFYYKFDDAVPKPEDETDPDVEGDTKEQFDASGEENISEDGNSVPKDIQFEVQGSD